LRTRQFTPRMARPPRIEVPQPTAAACLPGTVDRFVARLFPKGGQNHYWPPHPANGSKTEKRCGRVSVPALKGGRITPLERGRRGDFWWPPVRTKMQMTAILFCGSAARTAALVSPQARIIENIGAGDATGPAISRIAIHRAEFSGSISRAVDRRAEAARPTKPSGNRTDLREPALVDH